MEGFTRVFGEGATAIRAPGPVLSVAEREVMVEGLVLACDGPSPAIDPGETEILRVDGVAAPSRGGLLPAARKGPSGSTGPSPSRKSSAKMEKWK